MYEKFPYVHEDIVEYLDDMFTFDSLLQTLRDESAEYKIGYIKGARDIINHLRSIAKEQNER
mgnify:CR=1 FL=1